MRSSKPCLWAFLAVLLFSGAGCRRQSGSSLAGSPSSLSAQASLLADLNALANDPYVATTAPHFHENMTYVLQMLKVNGDGTLSLTIDGVEICLHPLGSSGPTDFYAALHTAVGELASRSYPSESSLQSLAADHRNLYTLIKSQQAGDLDLTKHLVREEDPAGLGAAPVPTPLGQATSVQTQAPVPPPVQANAAGFALDETTPAATFPQPSPVLSDSGSGGGAAGPGDYLKEDAAHFHLQRKIYLINGVKSLLQLPAKVAVFPAASVAAASLDPACNRRQDLLSAAVIPFHRGDLDSMCQQKVDQYVRQGFHRINIVFPVHYAGGYYPNGVAAPTRPVAGIDYRLESLNAPEPGELRRCADYVLSRGLALTYLPHVESIVTMNSTGESEWRIFTRMRLDDQSYYARAYAPLVQAINAAGKPLGGRPVISLAAEYDNSFLAYPDADVNLIQRLKQELNLPRASYDLTFNPNGDFNAASDPQPSFKANQIEGCAVLKNILAEVDSIAPSIYDAYGHVSPYRDAAPGQPLPAPDFAATRERFLASWGEGLDNKTWNKTTGGFCPGVGSFLQARFANRFSIGEFSLQGARSQFYSRFINAALAQETGQFSRMNFWNDGNSTFDPLVSPMTTADVISTLRCH